MIFDRESVTEIASWLINKFARCRSAAPLSSPWSVGRVQAPLLQRRRRGSRRPPGVCIEPPWSGYDCSAPRSDEGFIYVHSPAADLGLRQRGSMTPVPGAEVVFLDRLMKDWSVRTLDPHRALWYVPTWLLSAYDIVYEGVSITTSL